MKTTLLILALLSSPFALARERDSIQDIVRACKNAFVGQDELTCSRYARSVSAIHACVAAFVGRDELTCAMHARDAETVRFCKDEFVGSDELACIMRGGRP